MSTGAIIGIVIGAIAAVVIVAGLVYWQRNRRLEKRRVEAREHRELAEDRSRQAALAEAEAKERTGRAEREQLAAQEQQQRAAQEQAAARASQERADELDPDRDEGEAEDRSE
jgi:FtsZ-interacting cell division protein ZipA